VATRLDAAPQSGKCVGLRFLTQYPHLGQASKLAPWIKINDLTLIPGYATEHIVFNILRSFIRVLYRTGFIAVYSLKIV